MIKGEPGQLGPQGPAGAKGSTGTAGKRGLRNSNERKHDMSRPVRAKESFEIHHIFGQLSVF